MRVLTEADRLVSANQFRCELAALGVDIDWHVRTVIFPYRIVVLQSPSALNGIEAEAVLIPKAVWKS